MACDLTLGRKISCKDNVGGVKAIYFINDSALAYDDMTIVDESITTFGVTPLSAYKYELKGANSLEEANEVSAENGTSFWNQTLTAILQKQDATTQKQIKLMSYGNPKVIVETYLGTMRLAGAQNGLTVQANTTTGAAMGDLNGYNLSMTGLENSPAPYVSALAFAELTVVEGT